MSATAGVANVLNLKPVVKHVNMDEVMQVEAVECATLAVRRHKTEKDIANFIKREFDNKHTPNWNCIVGRNFGTAVAHEKNRFIYMILGDIAIQLLKSV